MQLLRSLWLPPTTGKGIHTLKKKLNFHEKYEKVAKIVIPGKLLGFERSYLEAKFTTPESTLTDSKNKIEIFNVLDFYKIQFFLTFGENRKKTYLENYKDLSSHNWS